MMTIVWIGLAGALGTLTRFGLYPIMPPRSGDGFPWATLLANVLGCYLFGVVWMLAERKVAFSEDTKVIVLTGFMGAFTTYSTFAFETGQLLKDGYNGLALANLTAQTVLGIGALFLGIATARAM